jgi:hypothetical protein
MTVQVIKLVLQAELPLIGHNLLYEPGLKEAYYMYCTYIYHAIICKLDKHIAFFTVKKEEFDSAGM